MKEGSRKRRRPIINIGRFGEILGVFIKFGFGDIVSKLNIEKYFSITKKFIPSIKKKDVEIVLSRWERLRIVLEELGPTFIKFGQFMSNRPDLLPDELITELEKLQDSVKPFPFQDAIKILESELNSPINNIVSDFSKEPLASASIAQVYKAVLKNNDSVVFKIKRPHIKQIISTDMNILYQLALLAENRFEIIRALRVSQIVEEFERMILKELDFTIEASHMERFRRDFKNDKRIYIPKVYTDLSFTKVLTTEFVDGIKVSDIEAIKKADLDPKDIAYKGAQLVLSQIFENGFFHADPHPGNILIRLDGSICFLDFGAIGIITPSFRYYLGILLYGFVKKDPQKIIRTLSQLSYTHIRNTEQLEYDITEFIEEYSYASLKDINLGDLLQRFSNIIVDYNIKVIPGFYLLLKSFIAIEGVGIKLNPEFSMAEQLEPFVKKLVYKNFDKGNLKYNLFFTFKELIALITNLPFDMQESIRILKSGDLRIQFEHHGLEPMLIKHGQLVNRLVFAIVLAALIIGSSIVIHSGIPPVIYGVPVIGIVGFLLAGVIGFGLLFSILHRKKL